MSEEQRHIGYHPHHVPESFTEAVDRVVEALKHFDNLKAIAVHGASGTTVGSVAAYLLKVPILVIRKPGESPHVYQTISGPTVKPVNVAWVDDFIEHGGSYRRVIQALQGRPGAVVLYANHQLWGESAEELGLVERWSHLYLDQPTEHMKVAYEYA